MTSAAETITFRSGDQRRTFAVISSREGDATVYDDILTISEYGHSQVDRVALMKSTTPLAQWLRTVTDPVTVDEKRLVIYLNNDAGMSRGKAAAQAVHAALLAFGVHPGVPVVVLGERASEVENHVTVVRDAGRTEIEPGTVTAGTDWREPIVLAENGTVRVSDGVWEYDETSSWYCCICTSEVGFNPGSRTGNPERCPHCGSTDIDRCPWDDDEFERTKTLIYETDDAAFDAFFAAVAERTFPVPTALSIGHGRIVVTTEENIYFGDDGRLHEDIVGAAHLLLRRIDAIRTYRGDKPVTNVTTAFPGHKWSVKEGS